MPLPYRCNLLDALRGLSEGRAECWRGHPRRGALCYLVNPIHARGRVVDELPAVGLGQLAEGRLDKLL